MIVMDLTDREMQLLIDCIGTNIETIRRRHDPPDSMVSELLTELAELDVDMREALHRKDDGWGDPDDSDLLMDPVDFAAKHDAETEMFEAGVKAREDAKLSSRAAARRQTLFRKAPDRELSETQRVDVWNPDDPRNW